MKLGAENRTKVIFAGALFVIAVLLMVRMLAGGGAPAAAATATAPASPARPAPNRARVRGRVVPTPSPAADSSATLDPRLRLDLLKLSEDTEYKGAGRNIFRAQADPVIPQPIAPPQKLPAPPPAPVVYTPPPPPPINLKFFGFANSPGEPAQVFLSQGDDVFVAKEGDIVKSRYKILKIGPKSVDVEDVLSNNRQSIPLTQG